MRPSRDPRLELARPVGAVEAMAVSEWDGREIVFTATQPHDYDCLRESLHDCYEQVLTARDAGTGEVLGSLAGAGGDRLAASGSVAALGNWAEPLRVWDLATGEDYSLPVRDPVGTVALTPSGLLAIGDIKGTVQIWDCAARRPVCRIDAGHGYVKLAAITHEGRDLIFTSAPDGQLWDMRTGQRLGPAIEDLGASLALLTVLSGDLVPVTAHRDGRIRSWDWDSGTPRRDQIETRCSPWPFADLALIGDILALPTAGQVQLWDLRTGEAAGHLPAFTAASRVAAGRGGTLFTQASDRVKQSLLCRWRLDGGPPDTGSPHAGDITAAGFAGGYLFTGDVDSVVARWRLKDGARQGFLLGHRGPVNVIAGHRGLVFTGAGEANGEHDSSILRRHAHDGRTAGPPIETGHRYYTKHLTAAEVGGRPVLLSAGAEGRVALWDAASGDLLAEETSGAYGPLALAPGELAGRPVVAITRWHTDPVTLWHLDSLTSTSITLDDGEVVHGVFEVDGQAHLLTLRHHTELRRRRGGHAEVLDAGPHRVTALAFGSVGSSPVAVLARADGTVVVRDGRSGTIVGGPFLLPNAAMAVALSPEGHLVLCHDNDIILLSWTAWTACTATRKT